MNTDLAGGVGGPDTDPLYTIHRSHLCAPGRDPVKLHRLGAGQFCTAYLIGGGPSNGNFGRVLLVVREDCYDKEILRELHRDNPDNPHLPAVVEFGDLRNEGRLYVAPLYGKLSKAETPEAWADWLLIRRAQTAARKRLDEWRQGQRASFHDGCYYNQFFIDEAELLGLRPQLMDALRDVFEGAGNYGSTVWMEFRPGNLGVDGDGRLVLLDPTFDVKKLWSQREAKRKQNRGW